LTALPYEAQPVTDTDDCLQGGFKIHELVHVLPDEEKKAVTIRKCRVCSANKCRKETSVKCLSYGEALCTTVCCSKYVKKNYQTGTQKFNIIQDSYCNISFNETVINY
jgi:hypothetical protein